MIVIYAIVNTLSVKSSKQSRRLINLFSKNQNLKLLDKEKDKPNAWVFRIQSKVSVVWSSKTV